MKKRLFRILLVMLCAEFFLFQTAYGVKLPYNEAEQQRYMVVKQVEAEGRYVKYHCFENSTKQAEILEYLEVQADTITERKNSPNESPPRSIIGAIIVEDIFGTQMRRSIVLPDDSIIWGGDVWQGQAKGAYAGLNAMISGEKVNTELKRVMVWDVSERPNEDGHISCKYYTNRKMVDAELSYIAHLIPISSQPQGVSAGDKM